MATREKTSSAASGGYAIPLRQLIDNLDVSVKQLHDRNVGRKESDGFEFGKFWEKLEQAASVVSNEATRLSVMFSGSPLPSEKDCKALVDRMEAAVIVTLSAFYALPQSRGFCLWGTVRDGVVAIVEGVQTLASALVSSEGPCSPERLRRTGCVWEACSAISDLPRDQCQAVTTWLKGQQRLLQDALEELAEVKENNGASMGDLDDLDAALGGEANDEEEAEAGGSAEWSEQEKALAVCAEGLVKASKALVKKLGAAVSSNCRQPDGATCSALDDLQSHVKPLSARVDDVVSSVPAPISTAELTTEIDALATCLQMILDFARTSPACLEDAASWLDFITKAVVHNKQKFYSQLAPTDK